MPGVPTSKNRLSRRQEQILFFIRESVESRGFPPSIREIGEAVGLSSSSTVHSHLRSLETKGYLKRNPSKPRSIELLDGSNSRPKFVDLPIAPSSGRLTANHDGEPGSKPLTLPLPMELAGSRENFLFTVKKNYSQESIMTGDLVIVDRANEAIQGDIILADGPGGVELTRFTADPPEDPAAILGRVVGVIRKLDQR